MRDAAGDDPGPHLQVAELIPGFGRDLEPLELGRDEPDLGQRIGPVGRRDRVAADGDHGGEAHEDREFNRARTLLLLPTSVCGDRRSRCRIPTKGRVGRRPQSRCRHRSEGNGVRASAIIPGLSRWMAIPVSPGTTADGPAIQRPAFLTETAPRRLHGAASDREPPRARYVSAWSMLVARIGSCRSVQATRPGSGSRALIRSTPSRAGRNRAADRHAG